MISREHFREVVDEVISQESYIDSYFINDYTVYVTFTGRRRGGLWQAQLNFNDDGTIAGVYTPYATSTPSIIARKIERNL